MFKSSPSFWARNAPAPTSLASTWTTKSFVKSGKHKTGALLSNRLTSAKASSCSWLQRFAIDFTCSFCVSSTSGAITVERSGINFLTKLIIPKTERSSLIVLGVGKSVIALIRSSPMRIPSFDKIWPRYLTSFGPNCTFEGFRVRPAAWSACSMLSNKVRWLSQVELQQMMSSMYTKRPLRGPKCENARDIIRANKKGAFAIPKGRRLKIHFPLCVTKAVLSCSSAFTPIWWYADWMSQRVINLAPPTVSMWDSMSGIGQDFRIKLLLIVDR